MASPLTDTFVPAPVFEERHGAYGIIRETYESPYVVFEWDSGDERDECSTVTEAREYIARYQKGDALFKAALSAEEEASYSCVVLDQLARGEE